MSEWGWVRYERTFWAREDGRKMYIGHFQKDHDPNGWTAAEVKFWARRPVVAMRAIANSGKNPADFMNQDVN